MISFLILHDLALYSCTMRIASKLFKDHLKNEDLMLKLPKFLAKINVSSLEVSIKDVC